MSIGLKRGQSKRLLGSRHTPDGIYGGLHLMAWVYELPDTTSHLGEIKTQLIKHRQVDCPVSREEFVAVDFKWWPLRPRDKRVVSALMNSTPVNLGI